MYLSPIIEFTVDDISNVSIMALSMFLNAADAACLPWVCNK